MSTREQKKIVTFQKLTAAQKGLDNLGAVPVLIIGVNPDVDDKENTFLICCNDDLTKADTINLINQILSALS
jgi:hypothetical protein